MDAIRNGNFTSSEIFRLMKPGKGKDGYSVDAQTYINECNQERRLKRSIEVQSDARPLTWGKAVEKRAFDVLGLDYTLCSDKTIQHPEIPYWVGSPDAITKEAVCDLKCPMTLTSFCDMLDPYINPKGQLEHEALTIEAVRCNHRDGDKFFWQIVSNAVLTGKKKGELIVYVPYRDELEDIKSMTEGNPDYYWIWSADHEKLPYLVRESDYKNINVIELDILPIDTIALTNRVLSCGEDLIKI